MDKLNSYARVVVLAAALCALAAFVMLAMPERGGAVSNDVVLENESNRSNTGDSEPPDGGADTARDDIRSRVGKERQDGNEQSDEEPLQTSTASVSNNSVMESGSVSVPNGAEATSQPVEQSVEEIVSVGVTDEMRRTTLELPEFSVPVAEGEDGTVQVPLSSNESKDGGQKSEAVTHDADENNNIGKAESRNSSNDASNGDEGDDAVVNTDRQPIESPELP